MAYELKNGQGTLFKNERKDKPNAPDYKGMLNVDGVEYWVSGWRKKGAKAGDWTSLSIKKKIVSGGTGKPSLKPDADSDAQSDDDMNDAIPF
jgi:uncharacterized protein (DUF736 family)